MKKHPNKLSGKKKYLAWLLGVAFIFLVIFIAKKIPSNSSSSSPRTQTPSELTTLPTPNEPAGTLSLIVEPDDHMQKVFELIRSATQSIDLVMYEFDDPDIENALADAAARGISVRVLLNKGYAGATDPKQAATMKFLQSKNILVKYTPNYFALTHQKTLILDNNKVFIMTFNFTKRYYPTSRDFGILDTNTNDVSEAQKMFNADWSNKQVTPITGNNLLWSPGAETAMILMIKSAHKTLDVYNEEMADGTITEALIAAAQRGITVRVTMSYSTTYKPAFIKLTQGGVHVRTYASSSKKRYIHAKMILADSNYAFVGSQNFSWYSLEKNRELGIFVSEPSTIASLKKVFEGDWNEARIYKLPQTKIPQ